MSIDPDKLRVVAPVANDEDGWLDRQLRPATLDEFIGQSKLKEQLQICIDAARERGDTLSHILLYGPPGLGKTTLAHIVGNEMGAPIRITSGPVLERAGACSDSQSTASPRPTAGGEDPRARPEGPCHDKNVGLAQSGDMPVAGSAGEDKETPAAAAAGISRTREQSSNAPPVRAHIGATMPAARPLQPGWHAS